MARPGGPLRGVAIIGMAGRFPGAGDVEALWHNLCLGIDPVRELTDAQLDEAGTPPEVRRAPGFVRRAALLDGIDLFDAGFFGLSPREAEVMDPQQRVFLECAWEALEQAGYAGQEGGAIGVFAGAGLETYLLNHLLVGGHVGDPGEAFQAILGNNKDFLATRVAYKLNLRGPAVTVQTACSTSLAAVQLAWQSLLTHQCDMALAGGITIRVPQQSGHVALPGGIFSPDGVCRPFDSRANGTLPSSGAGIVVLKRLEDALAHGDTVRAVIAGAAMNNDGSGKTGYTAPSASAQAEVIALALSLADFHPETLTYVETHGTGTEIGDPIEISGLTRAFRAHTSKRGYCALGSLKSHLGHLDAAAGVAGLIKTTLALERRQLPPTLHFEHSNPHIDFASSPFYVNTALRDWDPGDLPRRAGVSSFGIGGTNVHAVLREAPPRPPPGPSRSAQLLLLSGRSANARDRATERLAHHLEQHPDQPLADVAFTLASGRKGFEHRRALVCRDPADALQALRAQDSRSLREALHDGRERHAVFMFPGQGVQFPGMGRALYEEEPLYREVIDRCANTLRGESGPDLRELLYPREEDIADAAKQLARTELGQPATLATELALARLWISWGLQPRGMIGHSLGEFAAACIAGLLNEEDAIRLVAERGRLMQRMPVGAMLAVELPARELEPLLDAPLSLAAVNAPDQAIVAGPPGAVEALAARLRAGGVRTHPLPVEVAFHSSLMDPVLADFRRAVSSVELRPPRLAWVSGLTGRLIDPEDVTDAEYWVRHLRRPVRFAEGAALLLAEADRVFLELGPGGTLARLLRRQPNGAAAPVICALRAASDPGDDLTATLDALGQAWLLGAPVDWKAFYAGQRRQRVPLPTYPFERRRHWASAGARPAAPAKAPLRTEGGVFYAPSWSRALPAVTPEPTGKRWLIFGGGDATSTALVEHLRSRDRHATLVTCGPNAPAEGPGASTIDPACAGDYQALLARHGRPDCVVHLWSLGAEGGPAASRVGYESLLRLAQALARDEAASAVDILLVTDGTQDVRGDEPLHPDKALAAGLCTVIRQEHPHLRCRSVDLTADAALDAGELAARLIAEVALTPGEPSVAYRGRHRWLPTFEPLPLAAEATPALKRGGAYLLLGASGRIGRSLAQHLATHCAARLCLVSRSEPPAELVHALEARGAEVLALRADVADTDRLREVRARMEARFGRLDGVIHAAGFTGESALRELARLDAAHSREHFHARVEGLRALDAALSGARPDFVLVISSLASHLGGWGLGAYAAATRFMDVFGRRRDREGATRWITVDLDAWPDREPAPGAPGLTSEQGVDCLVRILNGARVPQVVVSTLPLPERLQAALRAAPPPRPAAQAHPRPPLSRPYTPPRSELERRLAELWEGLLGIERIGIHDNFFELGGHSLLATQLISRIRSTFGVELSMLDLLRDLTIAGHAARVAQAAGRPDREGEAQVPRAEPLDEVALLGRVEQLSDAEVETLLHRYLAEEKVAK